MSAPASGPPPGWKQIAKNGIDNPNNLALFPFTNFNGRQYFWAPDINGGPGSPPASFDEWLTIQNPNGQAAAIKLAFVKPDGINILLSLAVAPETRTTISVNSVLGPDMDASLILESSIPVVAERPMYFDYHGFAQGGHDTRGYAL